MGKYKEKKMVIFTLVLMTTIMLVVIVMAINLFKGSTTGDVVVNNSGSMAGVKCADDRLMHPVFADIIPVSYTNTITANFVNDELSSIMYRYDGVYKSDDEASSARTFAEADYNLILANDYDAKIDVFSHSFMTDGEKMALTITSNADKVTSRTAPYFLLDTSANFPNTLKELKAAYEMKGFSCTVENDRSNINE